MVDVSKQTVMLVDEERCAPFIAVICDWCVGHCLASVLENIGDEFQVPGRDHCTACMAWVDVRVRLESESTPCLTWGKQCGRICL